MYNTLYHDQLSSNNTAASLCIDSILELQWKSIIITDVAKVFLGKE